MSLQYSSPSPPVYSSPAVPLTSTDGYFGETGVYYDPEGITEVDIGSTASPSSKRKPPMPPINNPALRLMWLLVSSMVAVQEGNCQFCPTHNGLYPNVGNCKCYFKCIDGVPIQKSCPPGKKFDVMSMSCTYPTNTVCAGSLLQMLPAVMNSQGGNMMQQMQQMQQQQMQYQPMQQQQMQQMPQGQMQGGTNGNFHITVALAKPYYQGGGGGGNGGGGNGGNGGGGNGGNGGGGNGGNGGSMMQMMKMLMMMMQNQQQGTDQSMNQQNMMSQNMMNQNMMGQNMMNQNMMSQYMGKQKMYQNMMNQNMMGQGMGQQNMMGQGMGQQNMMGQGMGGDMGQQNMMQQNMMNQNMMQGGNGGGGGMGMGGNQQCVTCNRPKKEITITYNLDLKRLPLRFKLFG